MKSAGKLRGLVVTQVIVVGAFAASFASLSPTQVERVAEVVVQKPRFTPVEINRNEPLEVAPLYDEPEVVSDEDLAAVLYQIQPAFKPEDLKPNSVEHALRTWRVKAKFQEPGVMSGEEMRDFLLDYGRFALSRRGCDLLSLKRLVNDLAHSFGIDGQAFLIVGDVDLVHRG